MMRNAFAVPSHVLYCTMPVTDPSLRHVIICDDGRPWPGSESVERVQWDEYKRRQTEAIREDG